MAQQNKGVRARPQAQQPNAGGMAALMAMMGGQNGQPVPQGTAQNLQRQMSSSRGIRCDSLLPHNHAAKKKAARKQASRSRQINRRRR